MIQRDEPPLVLASGSAARQALLRSVGLRFEVMAAAVDEASLKASARAEGLAASETALLLAAAKARRVAQRRPEALVIGADQLLVCEDAWFDKPPDLAAARRHLKALRGRAHTLVNGIVCWRGGAQVWQHVATPTLTMRNFSNGFVDAYLDAEGEAILDSVGGYRLEALGPHLFAAIEGEHSAILGLPLLPLLSFLRDHGIVIA